MMSLMILKGGKLRRKESLLQWIEKALVPNASGSGYHEFKVATEC